MKLKNLKKKFNITGVCVPQKHYMVDLSQKLSQIFELIEEGEYFTINRPRQYGKTTTLFLLTNLLNEKEDYLALNLSFEGVGEKTFQEEERFCQSFQEMIVKEFHFLAVPFPVQIQNQEIDSLPNLSSWIQTLAQEIPQKLVLLIDEVDKNSNHPLFLNFLGMLREQYLQRNRGRAQTFQSIVLAGVHDVKNLKAKLRSEFDQQYNSPWNIAADFKVEMSFQPEEITSMLEEYATENPRIIPNLPLMASKIYYYTSGYPFLVSKLCKVMDEDFIDATEWTEELLEKTVQRLLKTQNTNFESLIKNIENEEELYQLIEEIILRGNSFTYNQDNPVIQWGSMYGIFRNEDEKVKIHNRIYEQRIYNYLSSKVETTMKQEEFPLQSSYLTPEGNLDFKKILLKFQEFMKLQYSKQEETFLERNGRLIFLAFLKPILNGKGFDFKEVQISEEKRLDVVITFLNQKFVIEMKIWKGEKKHQEGIRQLHDYLERQNLTQGYLLIFDFTKGKIKNWRHQQILFQEKDIFIAWV